jgi:hypothetical protein
MRRAAPHAARGVLAGVVVLLAVGLAVHVANHKVAGCLVGTYCGAPSTPGMDRFAPLGHGDAGPEFGYEKPPPYHPLPASSWYWVTPWWAYALAVVVAFGGVVLAVLIYSGGRTRRTRQHPIGFPF